MTETATEAPAKAANGQRATAPAPRLEQVVEFIPFMEKDSIKLSVSIVKNFVCTPTKSGKVCDDRQAMQFVMLCRARQLNPFAGDAFLVGYDSQQGPTFSLITAHQAFLKRAETHPEYDGMRSGVMVRAKNGDVIDREGDFAFDDDLILGAWATVYFKSRKYPMHKRSKLSTYNTGYSRWKVDPAGMIVKVSEADALRSSFPTLLGGMYLEEELSPKQVEAVVRNSPSIALPPDSGRQNLRGKPLAVAAPAPEVYADQSAIEDVQQHPTMQDEPTPPPTSIHDPRDSGQVAPDAPPAEEDDQRDLWCQDLMTQMSEAKTTHDMHSAGERMEQNREWLGPDRHGKLMEVYRREWARIEAGKKTGRK